MDDASRARWDELINASAMIFHEKGYASTTVQDVADALGILKGSVYHYIRTKEDLLFAVVEEAHRVTETVVETARSASDDVATELAVFVATHLDMLIRERVKISVYLHDLRSLSPEHYELVSARRREYSGYVEELIERGQREGTFDAEIDPHLATLGLLGMANWTYEWYRSDGRRSAAQIFQTFTTMALRSVGSEDAAIARALKAVSS